MTIRKITTPEDLAKILIEVGSYLVEHELEEAEITCGKLRVKVVADLINKEDDRDDSDDRNKF